MNEIDPIFKLPKPVIFGHRGGAGEAPESTIESFLYSLRLGASIIEVDVQLTQDEEIVVWHGPELDIAFNDKMYLMKGQFVHCWKLADLQQLWVRQPDPCLTERKLKGEYNKIISLKQLVKFVNDVKDGIHGEELQKRPIHLNIELKKISNEGTCDSRPSWTAKKISDYHPNLHKVLNILEDTPEDVTTIVGSGDDHIIKSFRKTQLERFKRYKYKTNLAFFEQAPYIALFTPKNIRVIGGLAPLISFLFKIIGPIIQLFIQRKSNLEHIALETPSSIITAELVNEIHKKKGGIYVFLSAFPVVRQPELEKGNGVSPCYKDEIRELLEMGVDGLMTDYPAELFKALKEIEQ